MTKDERQSDFNKISELEIILEPIENTEIKRATLHILAASRLLLQPTPNVDDALERLGMATGHLFNELRTKLWTLQEKQRR